MLPIRKKSIKVRYVQLCRLQVAVLITVAALDAADKAMLAASFPILERTLSLDVATLGYFSMFANLSYALSLPLWSGLVHRHGVKKAHSILASSCFLWGVATMLIAGSSTITWQAIFRCVNGAALASILPLSQMMLVEFVPAALRGTSFGLMAFMENLSATASTSAVVWFDDWRVPYFVVGTLSILISSIVERYLVIVHAKGAPGQNEHKMTMIQMFHRVRQIPTFFYLVCQGLFGAIPWDMMGFLLLLMKWRGFTPDQVVSIQFASGCCGTVGSLIGGILGDHFSYLRNGRIYVGLFSVLSGATFYGLFLHSKSFHQALLWKSLFHLTGVWTPAATLRPICAGKILLFYKTILLFSVLILPRRIG